MEMETEDSSTIADAKTHEASRSDATGVAESGVSKPTAQVAPTPIQQAPPAQPGLPNYSLIFDFERPSEVCRVIEVLALRCLFGFSFSRRDCPCVVCKGRQTSADLEWTQNRHQRRCMESELGISCLCVG
ncbi:hypothetical protein KIN20_006889 [Parelaphostrongylus tenuis]|uniref:Uncharacterized protein n=1 Tax=Parelaphostrongylus tenuis TaxID=148309 RepID=A0AAD5M6R8_PARTN|nr:hypothetical protein KIN20_006889 [Parelaphostrongylus tenuis]